MKLLSFLTGAVATLLLICLWCLFDTNAFSPLYTVTGYQGGGPVAVWHTHTITAQAPNYIAFVDTRGNTIEINGPFTCEAPAFFVLERKK